MAEGPSFANFVPGFEFLQQMVKSAGAAVPAVGQWVTPTLDPQEIDKRIEELRTIQFWLEHNARMLATTIQALEVQRMTLATLNSMNVQLADLQDAMTIRMPKHDEAAGDDDAADDEVDDDADRHDRDDAAADHAAAAKPAPTKAAQAAPPAAEGTPADLGIVDPMQWWNSLTKQFTTLASEAARQTSAEAARTYGSPSQVTPEPAAAKTAPASGKPAAAKKRAPAKRAAPPKQGADDDAGRG